MLLDQLGLKSWSEGMEAAIGGRVAPMIFLPSGPGEEGEGALVANLARRTDPFLMCVHHRHSFHPWDPFRRLQARFFPEGFPAHPHAGFNTLTYVLKGKLRHRDSMGVKQVYGDGAAQFLTAGKGVLHEEMWEFGRDDTYQDIELFQLWINLPRSLKATDPSIQLAGNIDLADAEGVAGVGPIPEVIIPTTTTTSTTTSPPPSSPPSPPPKATVRVIMGDAAGAHSPIQGLTPMTVLHVSCDPGARWRFPLPATQSLTIYARRGPLDVVVAAPAAAAAGGGGEGGEAKGKGKDKAVRLSTYEVAFFETGGDVLEVSSPLPANGGKAQGADFLLMAGEPLREPIVASGPFVGSDGREVQQAYARYQMGAFGQPWEHTLSDEEWRRLCRSSGSTQAREGL